VGTDRAFAAHGLSLASDEGFIAIVGGHLVPPRLDHLLDFMVRHYVLTDEAPPSGFPEPELLWRQPGTVAIMTDGRLPDCDLCEAAGARAPVPLAMTHNVMEAAGPSCVPTAMCSRGDGKLGLGLGQRLVTVDEIPPEVRTAFDRSKKLLGLSRGGTLRPTRLSSS